MRTYVEDFETMANALLSYAKSSYATTPDLPPVIIVLPRGGADNNGSLRVGVLPVGHLQTEDCVETSREAVAALLQEYVSDPEVLIAAHLSEAWSDPVPTPDDATPAARTEVLQLMMVAADAQAWQHCPLTRSQDRVTIGNSMIHFRGPTYGVAKFFGTPGTFH